MIDFILSARGLTRGLEIAGFDLFFHWIKKSTGSICALKSSLRSIRTECEHGLCDSKMVAGSWNKV